MKRYALQTFLLLSFAAILSYINHIWIRYNLSHIPPSWDQSFYIYLCLSEYDLLRNGDVWGFVKFIFQGSPWAGPLVPITTVPFYFIFGPDIQTAYVVNSLYLFILFLSVFFIGKRLSGTWAAVLSVFSCATFPAFIAYPRDYLYEFPLAALTALSYFFLFKSDSFRVRKYAVLSGIITGLALLAKTMGVVFFVVPVVYVISYALRDNDSGKRKNTAFFLFSAAAVAMVYYIPNLGRIFGYLFHFGFGKGSENYTFGVSVLSFKNWTIYLHDIARRGVSVGYFLLFLLSFVLYVSRKIASSRDYVMLWLWFIGGYVFLSLTPTKGGERFALPILAPLAILMSVHLAALPRKVLKYFMIALVAVVGLTNYSYQTFSARSEYKPFFIGQVQFIEPVHHSYYFQQDAGTDYQKPWDPTVLLRSMDSLEQGSRHNITVLVGVDHHFLNYGIMELYGKMANMKGLVGHKFTVRTVSYELLNEDEIRRAMNESDFVVTKAGYLGPAFSNGNNETVRKLLEGEAPLATFMMNDGSAAYIYPGGGWLRHGKRAPT